MITSVPSSAASAPARVGARTASGRRYRRAGPRRSESPARLSCIAAVAISMSTGRTENSSIELVESSSATVVSPSQHIQRGRGRRRPRWWTIDGVHVEQHGLAVEHGDLDVVDTPRVGRRGRTWPLLPSGPRIVVRHRHGMSPRRRGSTAVAQELGHRGVAVGARRRSREERRHRDVAGGVDAAADDRADGHRTIGQRDGVVDVPDVVGELGRPVDRVATLDLRPAGDARAWRRGVGAARASTARRRSAAAGGGRRGSCRRAGR